MSYFLPFFIFFWREGGFIVMKSPHVPCCRAQLRIPFVRVGTPEGPLGKPGLWAGQHTGAVTGSSRFYGYRIHMKSAHEPRTPQGKKIIALFLSLIKTDDERFEVGFKIGL